MFGKWFASAYTGSLFGAGLNVFGVLPWVVANCDSSGHVEINPTHLAALLGTTEDEVSKAIDYLCSPDPKSRSQDHEGRRLLHKGAYEYWLVNHAKYRRIRDAEARREQNRLAQQRFRDRKQSKPIAKADNADRKAGKPIQKQRQNNPPVGPPLGDTPPKKTKKRRKGPMPKDWRPGPANIKRALELALDLHVEVERFRAWTEAKGMLYVSWDAAFRNHLIGQAERRSSIPPGEREHRERSHPAPYHRPFRQKPGQERVSEGQAAIPLAHAGEAVEGLLGALKAPSAKSAKGGK